MTVQCLLIVVIESLSATDVLMAILVRVIATLKTPLLFCSILYFTPLTVAQSLISQFHCHLLLGLRNF